MRIGRASTYDEYFDSKYLQSYKIVGGDRFGAGTQLLICYVCILL